LGTSTSEEAKGYFTDFIDKIISYEMTVNNGGVEGGDCLEKNICIDKIELAFDKKRSDDRKMWLKTYDKDNILEQTQKKILYNEFIDKELIHFSNYDNERSIPSLCYGLKPSQRKIIYGCFKRNLKKEIKVAQLAGYISENSAYHHGEQSLYDTIIGLAQDFVGANNIELLEPKGQFGTRINSGGKDAASPRYIFTNLSELTFHIFNPLDNPILEYNEDDGKKIEPVWYIPILPLVLINGTEGIGTGFSTKIPPHDPEIIVRNLLNLLDDKPMENVKPWFRGFKGAIDFKGVNDIGVEQYINKGKYQIVDDSTMIITELPIGKWTDDYKFFLESLLYDKTVENKGNKQCLVDFSNNSTEKTINFTLKFKREDLKELHQKDDIENVFKLTDTKYTNYSNMHLYNSKGTICKYDSVGDIMKEFYVIRLAYYTKRKEYMLKSMKRELDIYEAKIRFIEEFISGEINILHKEDEEVEEQLMAHNFPKFGKEGDEGDSGVEENESIADKMSYDYLLNMKIKSLTKKKIEELKKLFENKMAVYNELMAKDEKTLWRDDLNNFLDVYRKKLKLFNEKMDESGKSVVKAKNIKVSVKKGGKK
jgi:DNA topoisomerase-2